jgi:ABC-2 type transport system permease protein
MKDRAQKENSPGLLVRNTWVQTRRLLFRWSHDVQTLVLALILPCIFLVALNQVFGRPVTLATGHSALYGMVPMAALVGAVFGSSASGISLMRERDEGLLARFWVLPVHRASDLLSRLAAEVVRILASSILIACTGLALGFRFHQGIAAAVAWLAVPLVFGLGFSFFVTTIALYMDDTVLAESTSIAVAPLFFFCTGFVPLEQYPGWLQPVVAHQPMSYSVEAMRGLALDGPVLSPLIGSLLWAAGAVLVCLAPMLIGYRKACTY